MRKAEERHGCSPAEGGPPAPVRIAVMEQQWQHITFLHWRYAPDLLGGFLPPRLRLDTFDGSAWLSLTPFLLRGLRPPIGPALPWVSEFPETNCRTYVRGPDGTPGVWFFSLDAARFPAVLGARLAYGLPYKWSTMEVAVEDRSIRYHSVRRPPDGATTKIEVEPGAAVNPEDLTLFLTARFRLYSLLFGNLIFAQVEHAPWPLQAARVNVLQQTITHAAGLPKPEDALPSPTIPEA